MAEVMGFADSESNQGERIFLEALFAELNGLGIRYAVMRNHETLPFSAGGSDLDLIIAPECERQTREALFRVMNATGGVAVGIAETVGFFKIYILGRAPDQQSSWWGLRVDVNIGVHYKGMRLVKDEEVNYSARLHNGVAVLSADLAAVLGALKEVLNNHAFPVRYSETARNALQNDFDSISRQLAPMGTAALNEFRELILSGPAHNGFESRCAAIGRKVRRYTRSKHPQKYAMARIRFEWSRIRRYIRPPGIIIGIMGVDGAGKSTLIEAIMPVLRAATHNAVWVRHLRPGLLPPLARLKGKAHVQEGPVVDPHRSRASGAVGSVFRIAYLMVDYVLGYWLKTRPILAKQPAIVLYDRYAYDMEIDPKRFRIALPDVLIRAFVALAPRPDLIICLHGAPEIISARKSELPVEETRRQIAALRGFARRESRAILVDTVAPIDDTRNVILIALLEMLRRKKQSAAVSDA